MRIVSLTAQNILRLKAVHIEPGTGVVQITGRNGQGKSSVLNAIWLALQQSKIDADVPIRSGETKALVRLELGDGTRSDLIVERKYSGKTDTITVKNAEGMSYPSPQKMLDQLVGSISFDPMAFSRMSSRAQFDTLKALVPMEVDIEELEREIKVAYEKRTIANRKAKELFTLAGDVPERAPELIDVPSLKDSLQFIEQFNAVIDAEADNRVHEQCKIDRLRQNAKSARESAALLLQEAAAAEESADLWEKALSERPPLEEKKSLVEAAEKMRLAMEHNARVERIKNDMKLREEARKHEAEAAAYTATIEAKNESIAKAVREANMPDPRISFGDGEVLLDGLPWAQASSAQQTEVSLAIAIAMNPKLRVLRIMDGSLLDDDTMARVAKLAEERDYQVWIERVDSSGKVGVVIEDGEVVSNQEKDHAA